MNLKLNHYNKLKAYVIHYFNQVDHPHKLPDQTKNDYNWQIYTSVIDHYNLDEFDGVLSSYTNRMGIVQDVADIIEKNIKLPTQEQTKMTNQPANAIVMTLIAHRFSVQLVVQDVDDRLELFTTQVTSLSIDLINKQVTVNVQQPLARSMITLLSDVYHAMSNAPYNGISCGTLVVQSHGFNDGSSSNTTSFINLKPVSHNLKLSYDAHADQVAEHVCVFAYDRVCENICRQTSGE